MSTEIAWTEETWNPVTGCTKISAGCKNCYAEKMHNRLMHNPKVPKYHHPFSEVRFHPEVLDIPLKRKKPTMYFVCSMSDLFHEEIEFEHILDVFNVIEKCPQHTFQILTKRSDIMQDFLDWHHGLHPEKYLGYNKNLWFGVTAENQEQADCRIPFLLNSRVENRFVSIEPMLGKMNIGEYLHDFELYDSILDWIIVGGESKGDGIGRECSSWWVGDITRQAMEANIPVFVKQLHIDGRLVKDVNQFPEDLQIQEYPKEIKDEV